MLYHEEFVMQSCKLKIRTKFSWINTTLTFAPEFFGWIQMLSASGRSPERMSVHDRKMLSFLDISSSSYGDLKNWLFDILLMQDIKISTIKGNGTLILI